MFSNREEYKVANNRNKGDMNNLSSESFCVARRQANGIIKCGASNRLWTKDDDFVSAELKEILASSGYCAYCQSYSDEALVQLSEIKSAMSSLISSIKTGLFHLPDNRCTLARPVRNSSVVRKSGLSVSPNCDSLSPLIQDLLTQYERVSAHIDGILQHPAETTSVLSEILNYKIERTSDHVLLHYHPNAVEHIRGLLTQSIELGKCLKESRTSEIGDKGGPDSTGGKGSSSSIPQDNYCFTVKEPT